MNNLNIELLDLNEIAGTLYNDRPMISVVEGDNQIAIYQRSVGKRQCYDFIAASDLDDCTLLAHGRFDTLSKAIDRLARFLKDEYAV